ncbi:hypothetical protein H0H92_013204 [Tricholoma furcatifolium]|nr:hypothetical protein H0H92_013204 [Tricholoma furcatifolium]
MCREPFIRRRAVKIIVENKDTDSVDQAGLGLLQKLVVSWNLELGEQERIELVMEVEEWLSNGGTHELLAKILEILRAQNQLKHELDVERAMQRSYKDEALAVQESLSSMLKEIESYVIKGSTDLNVRQVASLKVETSVYRKSGSELTDHHRERLSLAFKDEGNRAFRNNGFNLANTLYSRAIEIAPKPDPKLYANRAACYLEFSPQLAIEDCTRAINLDAKYVKAINRRGMAFEALGRDNEALDDFITTASLDESTTTSALDSINRVLERLASNKTTEIIESLPDIQEATLPSPSFVSAYFARFRSQPSLVPPAHLTSGDTTLFSAFRALDMANYATAVTLVNRAMDQGLSITWRTGRAAARNLRGTFKYLQGDLSGAKEDLLSSIAILPTYTQNFVKLARIYFDQGNELEAFKCLEDAIIFNEHDPDIYHHRGEVLKRIFAIAYLENSSYELAVEDFFHSIRLDGQFILSHKELAIAQLKAGNQENAQTTFRRIFELFSTRNELFKY